MTLDGVVVGLADTTDLETVVDQWVELANEQRDYRSRLQTEENRALIRETFARAIVAGTLLVARTRAENATEEEKEGEEEAGEEEEPGKEARILGFLSYRLETPHYEQDCTRGVIENLYVTAGQRNRGIGTLLLETAERRLLTEGCDAIVLESMADNSNAKRFYRDRGYDPLRVQFEKTFEQ